jgi:hypothetical protein
MQGAPGHHSGAPAHPASRGPAAQATAGRRRPQLQQLLLPCRRPPPPLPRPRAGCACPQASLPWTWRAAWPGPARPAPCPAVSAPSPAAAAAAGPTCQRAWSAAWRQQRPPAPAAPPPPPAAAVLLRPLLLQHPAGARPTPPAAPAAAGAAPRPVATRAPPAPPAAAGCAAWQRTASPPSAAATCGSKATRASAAEQAPVGQHLLASGATGAAGRGRCTPRAQSKGTQARTAAAAARLSLTPVTSSATSACAVLGSGSPVPGAQKPDWEARQYSCDSWKMQRSPRSAPAAERRAHGAGVSTSPAVSAAEGPPLLLLGLQDRSQPGGQQRSSALTGGRRQRVEQQQAQAPL